MVVRGIVIRSSCISFAQTPRGELSVEGFDEDEKKYAKKAEWISIEDVDSIKFYNGVDSVAIIKRAVEMLNT